jgi:hypothetical protein
MPTATMHQEGVVDQQVEEHLREKKPVVEHRAQRRHRTNSEMVTSSGRYFGSSRRLAGLGPRGSGLGDGGSRSITALMRSPFGAGRRTSAAPARGTRRLQQHHGEHHHRLHHQVDSGGTPSE